MTQRHLQGAEGRAATDPAAVLAPRWWRTLVSAGMALMGFFLPFSSAGVAIGLALLVAAAIVRPRAVLLRRETWMHPVMLAGLVLFAFIALHTALTSTTAQAALHMVNQYHELLFAPVVLALMHEMPRRRLFVRALFAGAVGLALVHWAALGDAQLTASLNSRRISAGFVLAGCAFLALMCARGRPRPWALRALSLFFALTVLFAIDGRTGHLVLLALAAVAAWAHAPRRWRWAAVLAAPLAGALLALGSGTVQTRMQETLAAGSDAGAPPPGPMTSTAIRVELVHLAGDLARKHWLAGAGFANYGHEHERAAEARYGNDPLRQRFLQEHWVHASNPHNEYAMQLVGGGIVALALFLAWLVLTLREARRFPPTEAAVLTGLVIAFAIGCVFNSFLRDFMEGHFYMAALAWALAQARFAREGDAQPATRILVVATRQIGDVLLTTPLIRAARERWPAARIEVLGFQRTLGMLVGNPDVQMLIETPTRLGFRGGLRLLARLWRRHDLVLVTDAGDRAHVIGWAASARRAGIIPDEGASRWWKRLLMDHAVEAGGDRGTVHVVAEKHALLAPWLPTGALPCAVIPPGAKALPQEIAAALQPGCVVMHAPSMWDYKQWPLAHYAAVLRGLLADGRQVVLTGSASERDKACIAALLPLGSAPQLLDVSGRLDFNQLVALLQRSALYIGPDTSVSHLAAAVGLPLIAVFGPTNPQRWAPWPVAGEQPVTFLRRAATQESGNVLLVQDTRDCVPCGRAGCEDKRDSRSDCLQAIAPERVLAIARERLARQAAPSAEALA